MTDNWIEVFSTNKEYLAEIAKQILDDNDIHAVILNKMDSSYAFGEIQLHVKQSQVLRAKMLLKNLQH